MEVQEQAFLRKCINQKLKRLLEPKKVLRLLDCVLGFRPSKTILVNIDKNALLAIFPSCYNTYKNISIFLSPN